MIGIVDVVGSNIRSLEFCLQRCKADYEFVRNPKKLHHYSHLILAGVGSAKRAIAALEAHDLSSKIVQLNIPILGICVGMQILFERCYEGGSMSALGMIPGEVRHIPKSVGLSLPHSGWNQLISEKQQHIFSDFAGEYVYFVHSYQADCSSQHSLMYVEYGDKIPAIVCKNHVYGFQFHPEKSAKIGQKLIQRFLKI